MGLQVNRRALIYPIKRTDSDLRGSAAQSCTINVSGPPAKAKAIFPVPFRPVLELAIYSKYPRIILTVTAFVVAAFVIAPAGGTDPVALKAAGLYADPAACAQCHPAIAATY